MKKMTALIFSLLGILGILSGCGGTQPTTASPGGAASHVTDTVQPAAFVLSGTIADGAADGNLLLAKEGGTSAEVYRLSVGKIPVTVDGAAAFSGDLKDGMTVTVSCSGNVLETFPEQLCEVSAIDARTPVKGGYTDLCGFYLQVLDDLWNTDGGLNSGLKYAGIDLSDEPSGLLSDSEKAAIAWRFGEEHGVETVQGTRAELAAQGYLDAEHLQWENGCLFSISANHAHDTERYSLPVLNFDAEKWRSGTGAYFFSDCTCVWPESGSWTTYQVGSQAIS